MNKYLFYILIVLGICLRVFAYFRGISFWGDEAALALNIYEHSYLELFKGLDYLQVAPPFFLIMTKFLISIFDSDFMFRLIPFLSGLAAIPLFFKFVSQISNNKTVIRVSTFIFTFNVTAILYCAQFKQYSFELLIALILLMIFYKIIYKNEYKWIYSLIIAFAPWFSLSSLFIIGSYLLLILLQNTKEKFNYKFIYLFIPFFISLIVYYFLSLKYVSNHNYSGMYDWWNNGYGFIDFAHPLRFVIRFGEIFTFDKITAIIVGGIILSVGFLSLFTNCSNRLFLIFPIIFTYLASALKLYPIEARLVLFLLPLFVVIVSEYNWKFKNIILLFVCIISFVTSIYYTFKPYKFYTSAREVVKYVENRIKNDEKIILDSAYHRYYYYLKKKNNIIIFNLGCDSFSDACNDNIEQLPQGKYYLILKEHPREALTANIKILDEYNLHSSVIYFSK